MKYFFLILMFADILAIISCKGLKRFGWFMAGIFLIHDGIGIQPFGCHTLFLTALFISLWYHKELKIAWKNFPFKWIIIVILIIHVLVVQFDERSYPPLTYISRVYNNFVPRFFSLFLGYALIDYKRSWGRYVKPMAIIFLVMTVYGFITFLLQGNPIDDLVLTSFNQDKGIWSDVQSRGYRVFSTLSNPIVYSYVMFIAFSYIYIEKKWLTKKTYYLLLVLTLLNAFLANSRTGIVAGAILIAVYAVFEYKASLRMLGFGVTLLLVLMVLYNNVTFVKDAMDSVVDIFTTGGENTGGSNVELKQNQLNAALMYFAQHPYFGNGFYYFVDVLAPRDMQGDLVGLEGYGYQLLLEEGIFMIIAVITLFASIILYFFKRLKVKQISSMGIAWTVSFVFYLLTAGTNGGIFIKGMLFIGMALRYTQLMMPHTKQQERTSPKITNN